jgi:hypothetical protein
MEYDSELFNYEVVHEPYSKSYKLITEYDSELFEYTEQPSTNLYDFECFGIECNTKEPEKNQRGRNKHRKIAKHRKRRKKK